MDGWGLGQWDDAGRRHKQRQMGASVGLGSWLGRTVTGAVELPSTSIFFN